jgi:uncharacterized repeat protein (TIGR01451 family)
MKTYKRFAMKGIAAGLLVSAALFVGGILTSSKPVQATDTGDCGPSSIITCGVKNVDEIITKYNAGDTQAAVMRGTYDYYGIDAAKLNELKAKAVLGTVYNDFLGGSQDVVVVNGKVVATNATTAGRVNVSGSTKIGTFAGVSTYTREYSFSNHRAKQAFILMDGEKFVFGVLAECGNPVGGDTPEISLNKEISKDGSTFGETANFNDGETATFRLTVRETSNKGTLTGVTVKDVMPAGYTYVAGSTKLDGAATTDITAGVAVGNMGPNVTKTVTFQAKVSLVGKTCGTNQIVNTANVDSDQTPVKTDTASGSVTKACPVVARCESMSGPATLNEGQQAVYTIEATVENTEITNIVFTVDGQEVQSGLGKSFAYTATPGVHVIGAVVHFADGSFSNSAGCQKEVTVTATPKPVRCVGINGTSGLRVNETAVLTAVTDNDDRVAGYTWKGVTEANGKTAIVSFDKEGTYKVTVTITPKDGFVLGDPAQCVKTIEVTPKPVYACDLLTISPTNPKVGDKVTITVNYTAKNGATFKDGILTFGDNGSTEITGTNGSYSIEHTYAEAKTYQVAATLNFMVEGRTETAKADCAGAVTVTPPPVVIEKCKIKGKEQYDANDKNCTAVLAAQTLVKTGPSAALGIFAIATVLGAFVHHSFLSKPKLY